MEIFGQLEKFVAELYPYRYPVSVAMVIAAGVAIYVAYRLRVHEALWQRKYWTASIGAPVLALSLLLGNYLLSPLWERTTLVEDSPLVMSPGETEDPTSTPAGPASPTAVPTDTDAMMPTDEGTPEPTPEPTPTPFQPRIVQEGEWQGADDFHFARGRALIIETEPGKYVLRVEDFSVRNGPDLFVLLSANPDGYSSENLNLGRLRATDGAFNYEIPEGTDIEQFKSVVVWCERFSVLFGTATLWIHD